MPRKVNYDRLFNNCANVYSELHRNSTVEDNDTRWFVGSSTEIRESLTLYPGAFNLAIHTLKKMGCIEQTKRGTRFSDTRFLLVGAPDRVLFDEIEVPTLESTASLKEQHSITEKQLRRLIASIGSLDIQEAFAGLADSYHDLNERIIQLEQAVFGSTNDLTIESDEGQNEAK